MTLQIYNFFNICKFTEFLRTYYGLITYFAWVGWLGFGAWLFGLALRVGRGQAPKPSLAGGFLRLEFLALALCVGLRVGRGQSQKPNPRGKVCGWSFLAWLFVLDCVLEEVKPKSPAQEGRTTKSSKTPKIPIVLDDIGESKQLP